MKSNFFKGSSILRKFLVFNFIVFLVLGIFTFLYLSATKPNLVKNRSNQHSKIINNTSEHINRLNIEFSKKNMTEFLLSTRFLFQNLDRVQLYDLDSNLLADTDTLDLVQDVFVKNKNIEETPIDKNNEVNISKDEKNINFEKNLKTKKSSNFNTESYVRIYSKNKNIKDKLVISETINNKSNRYIGYI